jgi:hypothetical protein
MKPDFRTAPAEHRAFERCCFIVGHTFECVEIERRRVAALRREVDTNRVLGVIEPRIANGHEEALRWFGIGTNDHEQWAIFDNLEDQAVHPTDDSVAEIHDRNGADRPATPELEVVGLHECQSSPLLLRHLVTLSVECLARANAIHEPLSARAIDGYAAGEC